MSGGNIKQNNIAPLYALLAAALYAINIPLSKMMLGQIDSTMMAAFLYLGAGIGMAIYAVIQKALQKAPAQEKLTVKELPYTIAMVVLDIAAPIFLMLCISRTSSANVSLLNNFEIVATSLIALTIYKEVISKRLWLAIGMVTLASAILSFEGADAFVLNEGSMYVLAACVCWGFENNCTKMISNKSSEEIVIIKGCFSGLGSLVIAFLMGQTLPGLIWCAAAMLLGFVAYGMSINFYILAQKELGAAKTSAFYSVSPFLGVAFSMILVGDRPSAQFYLALLIMALSTALIAFDSIRVQHTHEHQHTHTHEHSHDGLRHTHEHTHVHSHLHVHGEDAQSHLHEQLEGHLHQHGAETI